MDAHGAVTGDSDSGGATETTCSSALAGSSAQREGRREARERERQERLNGKLTPVTFRDISCLRNGSLDYVTPNVVVCLRGSRSQFDARTGRMRTLLPPLTGDCCQTFATLAVVILSSLGGAVTADSYLTTSTVNYILYIAAWMHQLTRTSWPHRGVRPTLGDLNATLYLHDFFPSKVRDTEFEVLFYNQSARALDLLRSMCVPHPAGSGGGGPGGSVAKRPRHSDGVIPTRGYVIVSGDYTVSIFSVEHLDLSQSDADPAVESARTGRYTDGWTFFICDSHGTQPWSHGKASITSITFGSTSSSDSALTCDPASRPHASKEEGLRDFATILFALLEEHRKNAPRTSQAPYMTWTPLRRRRGLVYSAKELERIIDVEWWPKVLSARAVSEQAKLYGFKPLRCFWGMDPPSTSSPTSTVSPTVAVEQP